MTDDYATAIKRNAWFRAQAEDRGGVAAHFVKVSIPEADFVGRNFVADVYVEAAYTNARLAAHFARLIVEAPLPAELDVL